MAIDIDPQSYLPGITVATSDGSGDITSGIVPATEYLLIPMAAIPKLDAAEVNGGSANINRIIYALEEALFYAQKSVRDADPLQAPTKWINNRYSSPNDATDETTRTYTHQIITASSGDEVVAEA